MDLVQIMANLGGSLQPSQVGVDHLAVALESEDQRHVHADTFTGDRGNRWQASLGGGNLDQHVRSVNDLPQVGGLRCGGVGFVGQIRIDLDGHSAVDAVGRRESGGHDVTGVAYVVVVNTLMASWRSALRAASSLTLSSYMTLGKRRGEDRRVGCDSADRVVGYEISQVSRGNALTRQVVQPDGDACICEGLEPFIHDQFSWMSRWWRQLGSADRDARVGLYVCGTPRPAGCRMRGSDSPS